jgi:hypothetical protein
MTWNQCSEARYYEMLGVVPPRTMTGLGFLVGEPSSYRRCRVTGDILPDWAAFVQHRGQYYEGPNLTMPEWRALELESVVPAAKVRP